MSLEMEAPLLIQQDLYFGLDIPNDGEISQEEFQSFVDNVITPRFPAGLTIFDANGQKNTKVVTLFVEDSSESKAAIDEIVDAYNQHFWGADVLQVTNEDEFKVGFSVGEEDLIDSDSVPELIQVDLFFGRNIAGVGEVTGEEFQAFLNNIVAPRVPGLTEFDSNGQFQDDTGAIVEERTQVVSLILEDTETNEAVINDIVEEYVQQFQQQSVLQAVNEDVTVSFGSSDDLIDNDLVPELIQADLYFGRNIAGVGEVPEEEFQEFIDNVVIPRFPELTEFDANGQFQDDTGAIVEESTQVVSLVFEDTKANEAALNDIIKEYIQQFQQQSFLTVVDEDIQANFAKVDIPIKNAGFEEPVLEDGTFTAGYSLAEPIPGWEAYDPNDLITGNRVTPGDVVITDVGAVNPLTAQYPKGLYINKLSRSFFSTLVVYKFNALSIEDLLNLFLYRC